MSEVVSQITINCDSFYDCQQQAWQLPIVGEELGGFSYSPSYIPAGLVFIDDYRFAYTFGPDVRIAKNAVEPLRKFVAALTSLGYDVIVTSGFRSFEDQKSLHLANENSAAAPGYSQHQSGFAIDIHRRVNGNMGDPFSATSEIRNLANSFGIVHPFDWDRPHYLVLDAIVPGATQAMLSEGIDPNDSQNILYVLIAVEQALENMAKRFSYFDCA